MAKIKLHSQAEIIKRHRGTSTFNDMMLDLQKEIEDSRKTGKPISKKSSEEDFKDWLENNELPRA